MIFIHARAVFHKIYYKVNVQKTQFEVMLFIVIAAVNVQHTHKRIFIKKKQKEITKT